MRVGAMGFEAVIDAISDSGKAAGRVADIVRGVDPAGALPGGDAGMPGSSSAAVLAELRDRWKGRSKDTAQALDQHADNLAAAAQRYRANDDAAEADISAAATPTG